MVNSPVIAGCAPVSFRHRSEVPQTSVYAAQQRRVTDEIVPGDGSRRGGTHPSR